MEYVMIVFSSLTTAKKINNMAETKFGIKTKVMQTPKDLPIKSCSYSLRIAEKDYKQVWDLIRNYNVYSKGVYKESDYSKLN